jgi:hypothetical protein
MDWKSLVKTIAPVLGTALGGPFGGAATKFLADKFLGDPNASESDVATAILGASPEKLAELKKLDQDFKVKMRELDIDVFKIEVQDRQSARELAKVNMKPQVILSTLYTVGFFAMLFLFMTGQIAVITELKSEFNIVLGVMTAAQVKIMDFWFGSSSGSKEKDVIKK